MLSIVDSLLQAILDDPEDIELRLVYADALEESGTPDAVFKAEFIRYQIQTGAEQEIPIAQGRIQSDIRCVPCVRLN